MYKSRKKSLTLKGAWYILMISLSIGSKEVYIVVFLILDDFDDDHLLGQNSAVLDNTSHPANISRSHYNNYTAI
jgi:hypothetical protein